MAEGGSKLSEEQIFECLKSLNVPVRMNDLKTPSRETIVRIFECFLKDLQIDITSHLLRPWEATKHIEDGDILEDGQLLALLAMSMNCLTCPLRLNITIKDIVEPKPKRTKKILNYILVFWNYYLQMYARFSTIEETFEDERKKCEDIILENESLDGKIDDKLKTLENAEPSAEELQQIHAVKEEKASKLQKETDILQTDYQKLKTKEFNLKEQINASQLNIIKTKEQLEELSQLILSSPKQKLINTEMKALEEKIKDIDAKTKECENIYKEEMKKIQLLEEFQKEEGKVLSSLNEIIDIDKQLSETTKAMVGVHQQNCDVEDKLKRLQMDLERKEDSQFQQEQKSAKLVLNHRKQLETIREVLKMNQNDEVQMKKGYEFVKTAVQDIQNTLDTESDYILRVIEKCKEAVAKSKERETCFKHMLKEIKDTFKSDCKDVMEEIKVTFPYEPEN